jgi:hypothetical protein
MSHQNTRGKCISKCLSVGDRAKGLNTPHNPHSRVFPITYTTYKHTHEYTHFPHYTTQTSHSTHRPCFSFDVFYSHYGSKFPEPSGHGSDTICWSCPC